MKEIKLTQDKVALVDDEDYDWLNQYKWCMQSRYAGRLIKKQNGKFSTILMHVFLLGGKGIDHKDGNGLNNQRHNLRKATVSQNNCNRDYINTLNPFGYRGVYQRDTIKFYVEIKCNNILHKVGSYICPHEAAKAYNEKALELHGEFAKFNTIKLS